MTSPTAPGDCGGIDTATNRCAARPGWKCAHPTRQLTPLHRFTFSTSGGGVDGHARTPVKRLEVSLTLGWATAGTAGIKPGPSLTPQTPRSLPSLTADGYPGRSQCARGFSLRKK